MKYGSLCKTSSFTGSHDFTDVKKVEGYFDDVICAHGKFQFDSSLRDFWNSSDGITMFLFTCAKHGQNGSYCNEIKKCMCKGY